MKKLITTSVLLLLTCSSCFAQAAGDPTPKQVRFFFPGDKLAKNHQYNFPVQFKEITITTSDSAHLSGILFSADSSKGVILYLHGNTGALDKWGNISKIYTNLHYDLFMLDYRGYGKSEGTTQSAPLHRPILRHRGLPCRCATSCPRVQHRAALCFFKRH